MSVPLAPGEEWGTRADFSPLVEQRDIDFARVSLPNVGGIPHPCLPEFLECRNGKAWPNDRPGLGVTVDERQLTFVETLTEEGAPGASRRRLDGSLSHW